MMSEYVSLESRPEENSDKSVGDDRKPNGIENEENASLRARETAGDGEFNTNKIVSGCTAAEATFDYSFSVNQNELDDANFQLRTQSISLNSDSTDGGFVTNEEEHENSTDIGLKGNSEVARNSEEDQTREMDDGTEDPFLQSVKYLEKHQILRLFQNFAAQIVYKRPERPFHYLIEELQNARGEADDSSTRSQESEQETGLLS